MHPNKAGKDMKSAFKGLLWLASIGGLSLLLHQFVFFVIAVPSASMYPAIERGDRILTTRILRRAAIERGDVLVFYSDELSEIMVKRVIGLPNETIEINAQGHVLVNGQRLPEPYVQYPDTRPGRFVVPDGEYFFLGDFRTHSFDSRRWEDPFIPGNKILGQARWILYPFARQSVLK